MAAGLHVIIIILGIGRQWPDGVDMRVGGLCRGIWACCEPESATGQRAIGS